MIAGEEDSGNPFEVFCCIAQRTVNAIVVLKGTTVDAFNIVNSTVNIFDSNIPEDFCKMFHAFLFPQQS